MPDRVAKILRILGKLYPEPSTALVHRDPLQLLISTILSAQCTDERVNLVTPTLFRKYRTAADFARAPQRELEGMIRSTGFFRMKARAIRESCRGISERFGGKVPETMEGLTSLRGVGRKTANVVLGSGFGRNEGVVVDTHVGRLSRRLGLTKENDPVKVERDLMRVIPRKEWTSFSHQLIYHGRKVCKARKPLCAACDLAPFCPSADR